MLNVVYFHQSKYTWKKNNFIKVLKNSGKNTDLKIL